MYLVNRTLKHIITTHPISCIFLLKAAISKYNWSLSHIVEIVMEENKIKELENDGYGYLNVLF